MRFENAKRMLFLWRINLLDGVYLIWDLSLHGLSFLQPNSTFFVKDFFAKASLSPKIENRAFRR